MRILKLLFIAALLLSSSSFAQVNFNLAYKKYTAGNYTDALYWADKSIASEPEKRYDALVMRGFSKCRLNDFAGADKDLLQALSMDRTDNKAYFNMALNLLMQGRAAESMKYIDTLLSRDPKDVYALDHKASLHSMLKETDKAIAVEKQALALDSLCEICIGNMGWFYSQKEENEKALLFYNKALRMNPYNLQIILNRSYCYADLALYDNAIADLDSVLLMKPLSPELVAKRGEYRFQQKKFVEACNNFEDVKKMNDSMGRQYIDKYCNNRDVITYFPNGKMESKCTYKNGSKNGKWNSWYESGKLREEATVVNGMVNGKSTTYYENGQIIQTGMQLQNLPDGEWMEYYETGVLKGKVSFKNGKKNGLATSYFPDGKLQGEYNYKDDKTNGEVKEYHPNGKLKIQGQSLNGYDVGKPSRWDEAGNPITE
jgi:antitoxin component YwqK of YwqJK toxin-antitoxin module/Tfp pilus assembly protein PilF